MNWMVCFDYGKDSKQVFSDMVKNKDSAVEALQSYQEKYGDEYIRIIAVVPVNKNVFENYYSVDANMFDRGQNEIAKMRNKIAISVGSYER